MDNVGALLRLLSARQNVASRQSISRWIVAACCVFVLIYVLACAGMISGLVRALRAGGWGNLPLSGFGWYDFTQGIVMAAFAAFCLGIFVASARTYITKQQLYAALRLLRFVAAGNDESLAPPATWLLDELRNEPVPAVPARFGPLPPITVPNADGFTLVGSITWVVGALFAIVWPGLALASASNEAGWWGVSFGIGGLAAIIIGIVLLRIAKHIRRPLTVSADEIGLRWTPPGRGAAEVQIRWSEARSFFVVQYIETVSGIHRHVAFVLDAPDTTLIWDERTSNKPEALGVSDSLCALILARTGLPLRDLTGIAVKLTSPRWKPVYASLPEAFWQPLPSDDPTLPTLPVPSTRWRLARPAFYVAIPMLLLLAVLSVVGFILPH